MKSTYKLFGTVWDGIEDEPQMDLPDYENASPEAIISLRALLSAYNESEITKILEPYSGFETIVVDLDCIYSNANPVIKTFVEKRTRQIISYLSHRFKTVYCYKNSDKKIPSGATNT